MQEKNNADRLLFLNQKVKNRTATNEETEEYMNFLYMNGSIT